MRISQCALTKSKKLSSHLWLERQGKDLYVREREKEGYVARSAFKLVELNAKKRFLKKGSLVLDLGAAPGGWTQVALRAGCKVVSNDLLEHSIPTNDVSFGSIRWVKGDFTAVETQQSIIAAFGTPEGGKVCDVVLCDAAPSYSGSGSLDHLRLVVLAEKAFEMSNLVLKDKGGTLVMKVSRGGDEMKLKEKVKLKFKTVDFIKPDASRKESSEIYMVATR